MVHIINPLKDTTEISQNLQNPSVSPNLSDYDFSVYSVTTLEPGSPQEALIGETSKKMKETVSETLTTNTKVTVETGEGSKAGKISKIDKSTVADDRGQRSPQKAIHAPKN